MKMTSLAKFFRFCGFGVASVSLLLALGAAAALTAQGFSLPMLLGLIGVGVLFMFAVSWIVLSYGLQREGEVVDATYQQALDEIEEFRTHSRAWYKRHGDSLED